MLDYTNPKFQTLTKGAKILLMGLDANQENTYVENPRKIMNELQATDEDLRCLISAKFCFVYGNGLLIIPNKKWQEILSSKTELNVGDVKDILKDIKRNVHSPSEMEIELVIRSNGYIVNKDKFYEYYNIKGWKDSKGNPIDWKQKLKEWNERNIEDHKQFEEKKNLNTNTFDVQEAVRIALERSYGETVTDDDINKALRGSKTND